MPKPGSYGVVRVNGVVGWLIRAGEHWYDRNSKWQHAFIVLDENTILEAQPGGAVIRPLKEWGHADYNDAMPLTDKQRAAVVQAARSLDGTPYGWWDYVSLALLRLGFRPDFVKRRVNSPGRLICSQLVDLAYQLAGIQLFDDGRESGDVTPGDLGRLIEQGWENEEG